MYRILQVSSSAGFMCRHAQRLTNRHGEIFHVVEEVGGHMRLVDDTTWLRQTKVAESEWLRSAHKYDEIKQPQEVRNASM